MHEIEIEVVEEKQNKDETLYINVLIEIEECGKSFNLKGHPDDWCSADPLEYNYRLLLMSNEETEDGFVSQEVVKELLIEEAIEYTGHRKVGDLDYEIGCYVSNFSDSDFREEYSYDESDYFDDFVNHLFDDLGGL